MSSTDSVHGETELNRIERIAQEIYSRSHFRSFSLVAFLSANKYFKWQSAHKVLRGESWSSSLTSTLPFIFLFYFSIQQVVVLPHLRFVVILRLLAQFERVNALRIDARTLRVRNNCFVEFVFVFCLHFDERAFAPSVFFRFFSSFFSFYSFSPVHLEAMHNVFHRRASFIVIIIVIQTINFVFFFLWRRRIRILKLHEKTTTSHACRYDFPCFHRLSLLSFVCCRLTANSSTSFVVMLCKFCVACEWFTRHEDETKESTRNVYAFFPLLFASLFVLSFRLTWTLSSSVRHRVLEQILFSSLLTLCHYFLRCFTWPNISTATNSTKKTLEHAARIEENEKDGEKY